MSAYRLYRNADPGRFAISLVHGWPEQEAYDLFEQQHLLAPISLKPIDQVRFLSRARRWLSDHASSFDVFHGIWGYHLTVRPACRAEQLGLPAVVKLAGHRADLASKGDWKAIFGLYRRRRKMIRRLSGVIAISRLIAEELRGYGVPESKIAEIPNGVDTDIFRPARDDAERTDLRQRLGWRSLPTVLFVGEVDARKQPHLLVEALGLLKARGTECQLAIAGPIRDQGYREATMTRADGLGVADRIIWCGFTREIADLYRASDLFSLPSTSEGMPNALLEAMASGLPSVATAISGIVDLVRDGVDGALVESDADQIADAMAAILSDSAFLTACRQDTRRRIEENFSTRAVLDAHEQLFRRIMAGGDAAG